MFQWSPVPNWMAGISYITYSLNEGIINQKKHYLFLPISLSLFIRMLAYMWSNFCLLYARVSTFSEILEVEREANKLIFGQIIIKALYLPHLSKKVNWTNTIPKQIPLPLTIWFIIRKHNEYFENPFKSKC